MSIHNCPSFSLSGFAVSNLVFLNGDRKRQIYLDKQHIVPLVRTNDDRCCYFVQISHCDHDIGGQWLLAKKCEYSVQTKVENKHVHAAPNTRAQSEPNFSTTTERVFKLFHTHKKTVLSVGTPAAHSERNSKPVTTNSSL